MIFRTQGRHPNGFDGVEVIQNDDSIYQGVGFPIYHTMGQWSACTSDSIATCANAWQTNCCFRPEEDFAKSWIDYKISADDPSVDGSIAKLFETDYPELGFDWFKEMAVVKP